MASFALPAMLPSVTDDAWFPAPLQDRSSSDLDALETIFRQKVRCDMFASVCEDYDFSTQAWVHACASDTLLMF